MSTEKYNSARFHFGGIFEGDKWVSSVLINGDYGIPHAVVRARKTKVCGERTGFFLQIPLSKMGLFV